MTVDGLRSLQRCSPTPPTAAAPELVAVRRAVEALRAVKDDGEIEALRRACAVADRALAELAAEGALRPGRTELEVGRELDAADARPRRRGAVVRDDRRRRRELARSRTTGPTDRCSPRRLPQARLRRDRRRLPLRHDPHRRRSGRRRGLAAGDLRRSSRAAQAAGRAALAVGRRRRAVDRGRATSSPTAGHGEQFPHGSATAWAWRSTRRRASARWARVPGRRHGRHRGAGVYLPGRGGVRIEDTLVVTAGEPELLTLTSKELLVL